MFCPSCGGDLPADERFARLVVCKYCDSAIIWDEEAARVAGKMAVLAQTPSPFYVGGSGVLGDRRFNVLGRVRYRYKAGFWDEWFLAFDDGSTEWISEDENNFTLETCEEEVQPSIDYQAVLPGTYVQLGDTSFHVDEKDEAECEGGEGQLPFAILSGEKVPFLDLSAGKEFATIEFDPEEGAARVFRGRRMELSEVQMDMTAEEAGVTGASGLQAERAGTEETRERIVRRDDRSKDIKCFACGGPLQIPDPGAKSMTCSYCSAELDLTLKRITCPNCSATVPLHGGDEAKSVFCAQCDSQLDVTRPEPSLIGKLIGEHRPQVPIKLGQTCRFEEHDFHVVGHVRYMQRDEWGRYFSDEFLLYGKEAGYRWLIWEAGHYSLSSELDDRPEGVDPRLAWPKSTFKFLDTKWKVFERGDQTITWVDGELPWVAKVGDTVKFMDAIAPPHMLSAEWTDTEAEWYWAEYLTREQVAEALNIEVDTVSVPAGVAPHQPYPGTSFRGQSAVVMLIFALVFGCFASLALLGSGQEVARFTVGQESYAEEYVTRSFEITEPDALCKARFEASVDGSWVYLDVAVINDKDEALLDFSAQMSYYHGYEGGESWSEGSRKDSVVFKLKDPGTYRLLLKGQAGAGDKATGVMSYGRPVTIAISQGASLVRYHVVAAVLCIGWAGFEFLRRRSFESRRWGDDDDDDD